MPLPSSPSVGTKITAAWGSSLLSSLPGKMMGFTSTLTSATSSGTNGTTEALLAGSLLTVTNVEAGRYYTVTFGCKFVVSVANTTALAIVHASQSTITTASPSIYIAQQPWPRLPEISRSRRSRARGFQARPGRGTSNWA